MKLARELGPRLLRVLIAWVPPFIRGVLFRSIEEDIDLIRKSPLFDEGWYRMRIEQDGRSCGDPAVHYYIFGVSEGQDPGRKFSTIGYLQRYPDVARAGINPLVHYLKYGAGEGRKTTSFITAEQPVTTKSVRSAFRAQKRIYEEPSLAILPEACPVLPVRPPPDWIRFECMQQNNNVSSIVICSAIVGHIEPQDAVASGQLETFSATITAFCRLAKLDPPNIHANVVEPADRIAENRGPADAECVSLAFDRCQSSLKIADIWYVTDRDLRVRFDIVDEPTVVRFFQQGTDSALKMLGESYLDAAELGLIDVPLRSPFDPILISLSDPSGYLRAIRLLPFPAFCRGGLYYSELLAFSDGRDYPTAMKYFSRELLNLHSKREDGKKAAAITRLSVDLRGANGSEPIFKRELTDWLERLSGIVIRPLVPETVRLGPSEIYLSNTLQRPVGKETTESGIDLRISADSIPAIRALLTSDLEADEEGGMLYSYTVVDRQSLAPRWAVIPQFAGKTNARAPENPVLPPVFPMLRDRRKTRAQTSGEMPYFPLALRFYDRSFFDFSRLLFPISPDYQEPILLETVRPEVPRIGAVISVNEGLHDLPALLVSLRQQTGRFALELVFLVKRPSEEEADIRHQCRMVGFEDYSVHIQTRVEITAGDRPSLAGRFVDFLLFMASTIVLHDCRTLATLVETAISTGAASVGCTVVHELPNRRKGSSFVGFGGLMAQSRSGKVTADWIKAEDQEALFSLTTYPVLANSSAFMLVRPAVTPKIGHFLDVSRILGDNGSPFGLGLTEAGQLILSTPLVSVGNRAQLPEVPRTSWDLVEVARRNICMIEALQ